MTLLPPWSPKCNLDREEAICKAYTLFFTIYLIILVFNNLHNYFKQFVHYVECNSDCINSRYSECSQLYFYQNIYGKM